MTARTRLFPLPVGGHPLATMPRPRGGAWLNSELNTLKSLGYGVLVCLLTAGELRELELCDSQALCTQYGLRWMWVPIVDRSTPDAMRAFHVHVEAAIRLRSETGVAIHCRQGIGRASLFAAAMILGTGATPDQAWACVRSGRGVAVPDTHEQTQWLAGYAHYRRCVDF